MRERRKSFLVLKVRSQIWHLLESIQNSCLCSLGHVFKRIFQSYPSKKLDHRCEFCRSVTPSHPYASPQKYQVCEGWKKAWLQAWVLYIPHACGQAFVTSRQPAAQAPGQGEGATPEHVGDKHRHQAQAPRPGPSSDHSGLLNHTADENWSEFTFKFN